jgi:hypothetical protein
MLVEEERSELDVAYDLKLKERYIVKKCRTVPSSDKVCPTVAIYPCLFKPSRD